MLKGELDWEQDSCDRYHSVMELGDRRFYQLERTDKGDWKLLMMIRRPKWTKVEVHRCKSRACCVAVANKVHDRWVFEFKIKKERGDERRRHA